MESGTCLGGEGRGLRIVHARGLCLHGTDVFLVGGIWILKLKP